MATAQRNHKEILAGVIEAWQAGDALRAAAHFSPDARYSEAGREPVSGRAAIATHFTRFFRDGPPWRFDVDATIVEDDRACVVYRFSVEGAGGVWRERAGCAIVAFESNGAIGAWREYEG